MSDHKWSTRLFPKPTGNPGRDRNARTLQFSCFLLAFAVGLAAVLDFGDKGPQELLLVAATVGLAAAAVINRAGRSDWAARTACLAVLLATTLLVFEAQDGFRSHAMLMFPALLLISLLLLDRASYVITAGLVLATVAMLGIAERKGVTQAVPGHRSPTTYESILFVDLNLLVIATIGGRVVRDTEKNVFDLQAGINNLSAANRELVRTKEHLQESENRLKSAQRLTHVGSWHWDFGADHVACSEECKRIFGQPDDYAPSLEGLLQIVTPRDRERVAGEIQRGIAEKNGCSIEFQIARPDGELRTVTFTSQVFVDATGTPQHIFGACQDVTDIRRAQEEIFARQKLETVGTLANGIAHDFNNLLGAVLAQAELALSELAGGARPEEELKAICSVASGGSEIVRQLMIYSGREPAAAELANLGQTVEEMTDLLKVSISKRVTLQADLNKDLPAIRATSAQLQQIVMNLVMNASEAIGDRDGVIRLTMRRLATGPDRPGWIPEELAEGCYVQLGVADTGMGMTPEVQARVFDPFYSTKPMGHGLGLAVVSGLVRSLGGAIRLVSEPDQGTTFQILLPCAEESENASQRVKPRTESSDGGRTATALVVEDEDPLRQAAAKMLRRSGFSVVEAADGTDAMTVIQGDDPIDVMLLDVTLPGIPSREVLAEARRLRPALQIIVTSAYGEDFVSATLNAEIGRFLRKPYSLRNLLEMVRQALP